MTLDDVTARLTDLDALALTAWAEARGDSTEGHSSVEERIAVMTVIRNRTLRPARWGGATYRAVCLAPKQFSCWNPGDDLNHKALLAIAGLLVAGEPIPDALFRETYYLADGVVQNLILDRTGGATSYYAPAAMIPPGRIPGWAAGLVPTCTVGRQRFYLVQ